MPNNRHASPPQPPQSTTPRAPSLDPDTGEPLDDVSPPTSSSLPTADASQSGAGVETAPTAPSEADVWKDRHLRLAAEFDNFRKRITKERSEMWMRAQADLVARLADALDDLSRFAHKIGRASCRER